MAKIAILGTGIAGMGCAHFLHRHHALTVFEAASRVGGHVNTLVATEPGTGRPVPVDTGFMVYNETTYPLLTRLFAHLQVPVKKTSLSFSVRDDRTGLEWCGTSLNHLFAQRQNLLSLRFLKLLATVRRFNRDALATLDDPALTDLTLGEYVRRRGYGEDFFNLYLVPLGSAIWSTPPELLLAFPAATLLRFFHSHGLLGLRARPQWFTVDGGAREYRDRLIAPWRGLIQLGRPAVRVIRHPGAHGGSVTVMTADGSSHLFDQVIIATHADQALRLLVNPTPDESRLLSPFKYHPNVATLHTDASVLPRAPLARAACNYQLTPGPDGRLSPATHYWMNALQGASDRETYIVTLNRPDLVDPAKIIRRLDYTHPLFTPDTLRAQTGLPALNQQARARTETYFAGGYFRNGSHEDALHSALRLSELLLDRDPWTA